MTDRPELPLLGLVMIVRNESHGLAATLKTFKPHIGTWTIFDTGSTDDTIAIARDELKEIPGEVVPSGVTSMPDPFDFSWARNFAIALHGAKSRWFVMADADDLLINGFTLKAALTALEQSDAPIDTCEINIRRGDLSYYLPLVMRAGGGHRYVGKVHEHLVYDQARSVRLPGKVCLTQYPRPQSLEASKKRWERDRVILEQEHRDRPSDARTCFYLAQTYECLGSLARAGDLYLERMAMNGYEDERFEAALRFAKITRKFAGEINDPGLREEGFSAMTSVLLEAYRLRPDRAEPLYLLAEHFHKQDKHPLTYLFAKPAAELSMPDTAMFVDRDVYDWKAADLASISGFYLADKRNSRPMKEEARTYAEKALAARPNDERLRSNLAFFAESATEMCPGTEIRPIDYTPTRAGYSAMNPSIHFDGLRWRMVIRTTNYKIVEGKYITQKQDGTIFTTNVMAELNRELKITKTVEIEEFDALKTPRSDFPVHGFEDLRLVSVHEKDGTLTLHATATVCDFTPHGMREIVLLDLGEDYAITWAEPLRGHWSQHHQKNWMPVARNAYFRMEFVYSIDPLIMGHIDGDSVVHLPDGDLRPTRIRGGSQVVGFFRGHERMQLCLVHEVSFIGNERTYLHRWVALDDSNLQWRVVGMSRPFYFKRRGIEFCCGLAHGPVAKLESGVVADDWCLVASFSVEDREAYLAIFDVQQVIESLRPI